MTIKQAIGTIDELKANTYGIDVKIGWLSRVEHMVVETVLRHYKGTEDYEFSGYENAPNEEPVLIMPEPFAEAYIHYLAAQIDLNNADYDDYNNAISLFNSSFQAYKDWYNRNNESVISGKYFH